MRVLWVCNIMLPRIAMHINKDRIPADGGWLTGLLNGMMDMPEVTLAVSFPVQGIGQIQKGMASGLPYYGFHTDLSRLHEYSELTQKHLQEIIEDFQPDILHIFGTEYPHTLAAVKAFDRPAKTVIHIQGLVTYYARHFMAGLPEYVQRKFTLRDLLRWDNLKIQRNKFLKRSVYEVSAIQGAGHIMGRTDWDRACAEEINPKACYHLVNESLRDSFYDSRWRPDHCRKHSIFVSQGSYPIKGLHYVLEAMPEVLRRYPDARLYVAGGNVAGSGSWRDMLRLSSYGRYIKDKIQKNGLSGKVIFTGFLDEKAMCMEFLNSQVFVSPSSIENSPNSVGEAMLVGMPVVASDVGGVKNMLEHGKEGWIYPCDEPYMLSYYICRIFGNMDEAVQMAENAREKALKTHDRKNNKNAVWDVYKKMNQS